MKLARTLLVPFALTLLVVPSYAQCPADDALEPNDACSSPAPLSLPGPLAARVLSGSEDWFRVAVAPGETRTIEAAFFHASGDVDLELYSEDCLVLLDSSTSTSNAESVAFTNLTGAPTFVRLRVFLSSGICTDYLIFSQGMLEPCLDPSAEDPEEENDSCSTANPPSGDPLSGLLVTLLDEDYYRYLLAPGERLDVAVLYSVSGGDIDVEILDSGDCTTVLRRGDTDFSDNEAVSFSNLSGVPREVVLRVHLDPDSPALCNSYGLSSFLSPDPCAPVIVDPAEDDDTCASAAAPLVSPVGPRSVDRWDDDYGHILVPAATRLELTVSFDDSVANLDARLISGADCLTELDRSSSITDDEFLVWTNDTGAVASVVLHVYLADEAGTNCNDYTFSWVTIPDACAIPDDSLEENDECAAAPVLAPGSYPGLFVRKEIVDPDWSRFILQDGATLTVDALFTDAEGDVDIRLYDSCGGTPVSMGTSVSDNETLTTTNTSGTAQTYFLEVYLFQGAPQDCNEYDLVVDIQGNPSPITSSFCFGDGSGATCPCNNPSAPGHLGGCAHQDGDGAVLSAFGAPSVASDSLQFELTSAPSNTFALLVSGENALPQMGACMGCGLPAFDGLRCAGGNFLRHGTRATDAMGNGTSGWGPPHGPPGGLISTYGFSAGQERSFFVFLRTSLVQTCGTGQNSSNGIQVTFQP